MSAHSTHAQDSIGPKPDPRPDYIDVGIDGEGAFHVYRTTDETVHVVQDGERVQRYELDGRSINTWLDYVDDRRGWADQRLFKTAFGSITGSIRR